MPSCSQQEATRSEACSREIASWPLFLARRTRAGGRYGASSQESDELGVVLAAASGWFLPSAFLSSSRSAAGLIWCIYSFDVDCGTSLFGALFDPSQLLRSCIKCMYRSIFFGAGYVRESNLGACMCMCRLPYCEWMYIRWTHLRHG